MSVARKKRSAMRWARYARRIGAGTYFRGFAPSWGLDRAFSLYYKAAPRQSTWLWDRDRW